MKFLKTLFSTVLMLACLVVIVWSGYFLWQIFAQKPAEPEVLSTEQLFLAEEQEPAQVLQTPVEEPPAEEPPVEEPPVEEPPVEELPAAEPLPEPPAAEPEAPDEAYTALAQARLDTMTTEEKLWQMFIVTPEALSGEALHATDTTKAALAEKPVGGLVCFTSNLQDREQTADLLATTQSYAATPLFLAVDEEGGQVSRLGTKEAMGVTHLPAAADYGAAGDREALYADAGQLGSQLKELGFNLDFAPVADIITNPNNTEIGNRAYSSDPAVAAAMVSAMVEGLQDQGVAACLKHFPGHGSTEADSHEGVSVSDRTVNQLRTGEWVPFQEGIDAGAAFVMVGHQTNKNLSPFPASLSPVVLGYLRSELGFDGLIVTDSLQMGAIVYYYTSAQAAVMAVQAGADLLLMPNDLQTAFDGLAAAVEDGTISKNRIDESVLRILKTKYALGIME